MALLTGILKSRHQDKYNDARFNAYMVRMDREDLDYGLQVIKHQAGELNKEKDRTFKNIERYDKMDVLKMTDTQKDDYEFQKEKYYRYGKQLKAGKEKYDKFIDVEYEKYKKNAHVYSTIKDEKYRDPNATYVENFRDIKNGAPKGVPPQQVSPGESKALPSLPAPSKTEIDRKQATSEIEPEISQVPVSETRQMLDRTEKRALEERRVSDYKTGLELDKGGADLTSKQAQLLREGEEVGTIRDTKAENVRELMKEQRQLKDNPWYWYPISGTQTRLADYVRKFMGKEPLPKREWMTRRLGEIDDEMAGALKAYVGSERTASGFPSYEPNRLYKELERGGMPAGTNKIYNEIKKSIFDTEK